MWWIAGVIAYALALGFIWCLVAINPPEDDDQ